MYHSGLSYFTIFNFTLGSVYDVFFPLCYMFYYLCGTNQKKKKNRGGALKK